jgi:uncharacterized Zn finger protein
MKCKQCGSDRTIKDGTSTKGGFFQKYQCKDCGRGSYYNLKPKTNTMKGISEQELRSKHDVSFKIKKTAESLKGDVFYTEYDFIKLCEIANTGYRYVLESGQFDQFKGKAGGTVYWSHPDNIKRLKDEGVLK